MNFKITMANNFQKGQVFIMALLVSTSISAIALTISSIILTDARQAIDVGRYVPALYAADAGVERALYRVRVRVPADQTPFSGGAFTNGASYDVTIFNPGVGGCPASTANLCVFSTGKSGTLSRRIQVSY